MILDQFRQPIDLPDDFEAHIVFVQLWCLGLQVMDQIFHQRIDFLLWPVPILDRKGVEGQILDAQLTGGPDDDARGVCAGAMALDSRQMPLPGPAAIAIHDDGNMPRHGDIADLGCAQRLVLRHSASNLTR